MGDKRGSATRRARLLDGGETWAMGEPRLDRVRDEVMVLIADVQIPKELLRFCPPGICSEEEWRGLGIRQSLG